VWMSNTGILTHSATRHNCARFTLLNGTAGTTRPERRSGEDHQERRAENLFQMSYIGWRKHPARIILQFHRSGLLQPVRARYCIPDDATKRGAYFHEDAV
jgi:hypothetical protein